MKSQLYRLIYKYLTPILPNNQIGTGIKWRLALIFIGTEFHAVNLNKNREKLSIHFSPATLLQTHLSDLLDKLNLTNIAKILDVGAGPISKVGKIYKGCKIDLIAIDPVAKRYSQILKKLNLSPVVETIPGYGEKLSHQFPHHYFDLIHARNCIDHTKNPILVIRESLTVLKAGGYFYLNHYVNEGDVANYYGLHQWNFFEEDNMFYIANKNNKIKICVDDAVKSLASIESIEVIKKRIIIVFKKHDDAQLNS